MKTIKKLICLLLACALFPCAAAEASPLAQALAGTSWGAYAPKIEAEAGGVCAGVAMDAAMTRYLFVIAEKGADGSWTAAACYERLIPETARLSRMSVEVQSEKQIRLVLCQAGDGADGQYVSFERGEQGWRVEWLSGEHWVTAYEDMLALYDVRNKQERNASVPQDAIDLSPENGSFEDAMREAGRLLEKAAQEKRETARALLLKAFPYEEALTQGDVVACDVRYDGETPLAAGAVLEGPNWRAVYFTDESGGAPVNAICDNLVPLGAENVVLEIPQCEDEKTGWEGVSFDWGTVRYFAALAYDESGALTVTGVHWEAIDDVTQWRSLTMHPNWMGLSGGIAYGELCIETPELLRSMRTFDLTVARSAAENAVRSHEAGEAPFIPAAEGEYGIPQPCGAALKKGKWDVYTGPGKQYYREADGKASVSTNDWIQVFGREGDWALIQYRVDGKKLRFGYVQKAALADFESLPELRFEAAAVTGYTDNVTSDPLGACEGIYIPDGYEMTRLALLGGGVWMYVELTLPNGRLARMFATVEPSHG